MTTPTSTMATETRWQARKTIFICIVVQLLPGTATFSGISLYAMTPIPFGPPEWRLFGIHFLRAATGTGEGTRAQAGLLCTRSARKRYAAISCFAADRLCAGARSGDPQEHRLTLTDQVFANTGPANGGFVPHTSVWQRLIRLAIRA